MFKITKMIFSVKGKMTSGLRDKYAAKSGLGKHNILSFFKCFFGNFPLFENEAAGPVELNGILDFLQFNQRHVSDLVPRMDIFQQFRNRFDHPVDLQ